MFIYSEFVCTHCYSVLFHFLKGIVNETSIKNLSWLNDTKVYFSYCNVASSNTSRLEAHKEIGDEEPCYSTKISILSFIWAGLAPLHKARIS